VGGSAFYPPLMEDTIMLDAEKSLITANLLDDQHFAESLARQCENARVRDILEIEESQLPIRLRPGEAVEVVILPGPMLRVAAHFWHGSRLTCTELTSPLIVRNRPCSICIAKHSAVGDVWANDFRIQTHFRFLIPCAVEASQLADGQWQVWKTRFAALLEADYEFLSDWHLGRLTVGQTHHVERVEGASGLWGWNIAPVTNRRPLSATELLALRRAMPGVYVPDPEPEEIATFRAVAQSNWLNSPLPGRAEELLAALPCTLLVPCYFATKRTRVRWADGAWSAARMDDYGVDRLNKGNLAVLLGPPSDGLASIDWDTDEFDDEFRARNSWAESAMRSWASRAPGNYWFRIRGLPESLARSFKLPHGTDDVGEVRLGKCITVVSGAHPCGALYRTANLGQVPEITLDHIVWPDGIVAAPAAFRKPPSQDPDWEDTVEAEPCIDLSQVEGLRQHRLKPGALHGRCPVCALNGKDRACEHLMIYANGRWTTRGTCQHPHSEIYALIGANKRQKTNVHTRGTGVWRGFVNI
jgi:hypothetical protein